MQIDVLTLFPGMIEAVLGESIIGRARDGGLVSIRAINIRDYSENKHRRVDDTPYGGGRGMLMAAPPIYNCYQAAVADAPADEKRHVVYLSPRGRTFTQKIAKEYLQYDRLVLLCGHYEGIDQRVIDEIVDGANIGPEDLVIEIGPGIGVITYEAAQLAKNVIAVEIDKSLLPILEETLGEFDNVRVINEDILKLDLNEVIEGEGSPNVKIMGNLPYYITTPIIMKILEDGVKADSITIMMQKEVADRLGISQSYISRLEKRIITRLQNEIKKLGCPSVLKKSS